MTNELVFKTIYSDIRELNSQSLKFFTEAFEQSNSVRDYHEDAITNWLLDGESRKRLLTGDIFENVDEVIDKRCLRKPFTPDRGKPGDIDILLFQRDSPQRSVAIECKRIKVEALSERDVKINGEKNIGEGIIQANEYFNLGFSRVYLLIFLLHDGRKLNTPNILFRYGKGLKVERLYSLPWQGDLHEKVGIIFVEVYQISDRDVNTTYGLGICVDKRASEQEQPYDLTLKVMSLLKT
jgi:hypothetical protein